VDLPAQHRNLMTQHQQLDVLRAAVTSQLRQHPQDLPQQEVHQRSAHSGDRRCRRPLAATQTPHVTATELDL
jgi:hypothetical protein